MPAPRSDFYAALVATGFGSGLTPRCPGTSGSLAAVLFWLAVHSLFPAGGIVIDAACLTGAALIGLWAVSVYLRSPAALRARRPQDPGQIVIDEWAGMFVSLSGLSYLAGGQVLISFALFRFFDIIKPYPVSRLEKLPGAAGIMADDLMAGLLARICLSAGLILYELIAA